MRSRSVALTFASLALVGCQQQPAPPSETSPPLRAAQPPTEPPESLTVWNTYYYLALESDYSSASRVPLHDAECRPIAMVSEAFQRATCIEGSARLSDGRVINYASRCTCATPCRHGARICYEVMPTGRFPWGMGSRRNALRPLRSLATDPGYIPTGTVLYSPLWDGLRVPRVGHLGGFIHDGCFRADDVGGGIRGEHIDIFSGSRGMWRALERTLPTHSRFIAFASDARCAHLNRSSP